GHDAGDRTFAVVALGAAGFVAVVEVVFPSAASRAIQGVAAGVGFLGLGMIFRRGASNAGVRGLTTAAATRVAAAVRTRAGMGAPLAALGATGIVMLILELEFLPGLRLLHRPAKKRPPDEPPD